MNKVLVTGATGNVGLAVLNALQQQPHQLQVFAGVREPEKDREQLSALGATPVPFDFHDSSTYAPAFEGCDLLFLLRPPQIANVKKVFHPLIAAAKNGGVQHIIFLSVQGVQNSPIIPHHKIEKLIVDTGIHYTFLRPAYFMQNFTTTLREDLVNRQRIFLPAGNARFTVIDVEDIGRVAAITLLHPEVFINKAFDLTNN